MSEVDFVRHLRAWYEARVDMARGVGVVLSFGQTEDDRPKPSGWVAAEKAGRIVDLTVWSTGEAEFVGSRSGEVDVNEHHELERVDQLDVLLEGLLAYVSE